MQGAQVPSLVRELRPHLPWSQKIKTEAVFVINSIKKNQTNKKTILQGILIINYKLQNSVNSPVPFLIQYQKTSLFTLGKKREIETLGVKVRDRDGQTFQKALRHRESMNVLKSFFYRSTSFFLVGFF